MRALMYALSVILFSGSVYSQNLAVKFVCEAGDVSSVHRFEMVGEALTNCDGLEVLSSEIRFIKAKSETITELGEVYFQGKLKVFAPGEMASHEILHLVAKPQEGEITKLNLLLDYPAKLSSYIETADGIHYHATCRTLL